ncbi:ferric-chelate reductase Frp1 [Schizosaccharomyces cryophilus OY26]|uniref:ferric-chelate reductase (NADPH) n=1 Tax=Schizosaccharomyces cryophilus (strain OY26 / ATCC MYA-4695 / CBS 11777 / NBRC 106824 / NRRL Y48691) TaxID=653667 RepID=S9X736_SCHCR|nr:ferric-chelate reductase Frp1 [Schizosaccharomyces cryophilus OY26]EPY49591.1 ferric-chelate reductase Frp1 [Schizosaccharomyces cryophilus OY26]
MPLFERGKKPEASFNTLVLGYHRINIKYWVIMLRSHNKWAVIAICLIMGCLIALSGLYVIETARVKLKSYKRDVSRKANSNPLERIYLAIRNIYLYLTTHKVILTLVAVPIVFAISVPFIGKETPPKRAKGSWNVSSVGARCGFLATALYVISYFFSLKNNPFALMLFTSHEKMNYVHRRLSQFAIMLGVIHGFIYIGIDAHRGSVLVRPVFKWGYGILGLMVVMIISALPFFRRRFYEWFFILHHACSIGFIICIYFHHRRCIPYMKAAIACYVFDRGCRMLRSFINRANFEVSIIEDGVIYLRGKKPKVSFFSLPWSSGNHVYINIPRFSFWQIHPFTLASCPSDEYIELLVAVRKGFTHRLANHLSSIKITASDENEKAKSNTNADVVVSELTPGQESSSVNSQTFYESDTAVAAKKMTVLLDGPYGPVSNPFRNYSYVFLAAGGVGITYTLPILRDLLMKPGNTVHLTFVWSSRSLKLLRLFQRTLEDSLNQSQVCVHMYCHLTASYPVKEQLLSQSNGSNMIQYCDGKPNLEKHIKDYLDLSYTKTSAITACGSGTFLKSLKKDLVSQQRWDTDLFQHYEEI